MIANYLKNIPFTIILSSIAAITGIAGLAFSIYINEKNQKIHEQEVYKSILERIQSIVFEMQDYINEVDDFAKKWDNLIQEDIGIKNMSLDYQLYFNKTETFEFWNKYLNDYKTCGIDKKLLFLKNKISLIMSNPNYDLVKNIESSEGPNLKINLDKILKTIRHDISVIESRIIFINYFMDCWPETFNDEELKHNFWNSNIFPKYVKDRLVVGRRPAVDRDERVLSVKVVDTISPFHSISFMYEQRLLLAVSGLDFMDLY